MHEAEMWKDVQGYEGLYEVSSYGNVRSIKRKKLLTHKYNESGYDFVLLYKNGKVKGTGVHRLVAMAFVPNPNQYPIVNHKDENPSNNHSDNLEWCTYKYNSNYGTCQEKIKKNRRKTKLLLETLERGREKVKKPILQYTKSGEFVARYESIESARRVLGKENTHITECAKGKRPSSDGYVWKYERSC